MGENEETADTVEKARDTGRRAAERRQPCDERQCEGQAFDSARAAVIRLAHSSEWRRG